MYEADDGEYDPYESDEVHRPSNKFRRGLGIIFLIYSVISYGLAQTITLNNNNRVEFGQGVYVLKACDSFISITLTPSEAIYSGTRANGESYVNASRVKKILISGLDTSQCAGRNVKIQLFNSLSATPMLLFTDSGSLQVNRALLSVDSNKNLSRALAVTIINGYEANIGLSDSYQSLEFDSQKADYTLTFTYPLALVADVTNVTIETSNQ